MTNKITIVLNDKDMIEELIKNEETQIIIKDSVKNAIVKRLLNGKNMFNVDSLKEIIRSLIYEKADKGGGKIIREEFRELIKSTIKRELNEYIEKEVRSNIDFKSIEEKTNKYADDCYDYLRSGLEYKLERKLNNEVTKLVDGLKSRILEK